VIILLLLRVERDEMPSSYKAKRWQLGLLNVIAIASENYHVYCVCNLILTMRLPCEKLVLSLSLLLKFNKIISCDILIRGQVCGHFVLTHIFLSRKKCSIFISGR
jgi:hypothetical protein